MKKFLAIALALALCLSLAACYANPDIEEDPSPGPEPTENIDDTETPDVIVGDPDYKGDDEAEDEVDNTENTEPKTEQEVPADVSANYTSVHEGISSVTVGGTHELSEADIVMITNATLLDITGKTGTKEAQVFEITTSDDLNALATAAYIVSEDGVQTYKTVKYDLKRNDTNGWNITNIYNQGSFNMSHYDIAVENGEVIITPKPELADSNYTSEKIEAIKNETKNVSGAAK